MRFTEHQVKELDIISPVHVKMQIALHKQKISEGDVEFTIRQLDKVVKYIRDLRSESLKITRKGSREL